MVQAKQLIPELCALEGLELVVEMERCSNIFSFRVTDASASTEEGRERFTKTLQAANVRVSTGAPAHGTTSLCRRWLLINLLGVSQGRRATVRTRRRGISRPGRCSR